MISNNLHNKTIIISKIIEKVNVINKKTQKKNCIKAKDSNYYYLKSACPWLRDHLLESWTLKRDGGMVLVIWYEYLVHVNLCALGVGISQLSNEGKWTKIIGLPFPPYFKWIKF